MPTGTVKWFNNAKGYGFILPDQGGEDLFVHYSSILMDGYKTLKAGQVVSFEVVKGGKGLHATNIRPPDKASPGARETAESDERDSAPASREADTDNTGDGNDQQAATASDPNLEASCS